MSVKVTVARFVLAESTDDEYDPMTKKGVNYQVILEKAGVEFYPAKHKLVYMNQNGSMGDVPLTGGPSSNELLHVIPKQNNPK